MRTPGHAQCRPGAGERATESDRGEAWMMANTWQRAPGRSRLLRLVCVALAAAAAVSLGVGRPQTAAAATSSSSVGYLTDPATNAGQDLFADAFKMASAVTDNGSYTTQSPASALTVTMHIPSLAAVDTPTSTVLAAFDTLVVWQFCDISSHPNVMKHINEFLNA